MGASVGAVSAIIILAAVVFVIWRKKRRVARQAMSANAHEITSPSAHPAKESPVLIGSSDTARKFATELDSGTAVEVHELYADVPSARDHDEA